MSHPSAEPGVAPGGHRHPGIDGLRGLGIAFIVAFHLGVTAVSGGWFFLEGFFVVSGFLITGILLRSAGTLGGVGSFWSRRFRRLLPAALAMIGFVALTAPLWLSELRQASLRGDGVASLFYVANWWFMASSSAYDAPLTVASPLVHLWTLAIEEQFYLVWPLVVLVCRRARNPRRCVAVIAGGGAVASAVAMAVLYDPADPWRVYFSTFTHAHGLLLGACAAALFAGGVSERAARFVRPAGWVGTAALVVIAFSWPFGSPAIFRGGMFLAELLVVAVVLTLTLPGRLSTLFSFAPLVALGRVAYGLYLWHWPVIVAFTPARTGLDGVTLGLVRLVIAGGFTVGSYWLIERRCLSGSGSSRRAWAGIAAGFVAAFVCVLALPSNVATSVPRDTPPAARVDMPDGDVLSAIVVGDSTAESLAPGLDAVAGSGVVVTRLTAAGCGWVSSEQAADEPLPDVEACEELRIRRAADAARVDWVVAMSMSEMLDPVIGGERVPFGSPEADAHILAAFERSADELTASGARLAVVLPAEPGPAEIAAPILDNDPERTEHLAELLRRFADRRGDVLLVDQDSVLCPTSPCPAGVDGEPSRGDDGRHLSLHGAQLVAQLVLSELVDATRHSPPR